MPTQDTIPVETQEEIRRALGAALRRGRTLGTIARESKIGHARLAAFWKGGKIGRTTAAALAPVLKMTVDVPRPDATDPLWAAAQAYAPSEVQVRLTEAGAHVGIVRRGELVRELRGATVDAVVRELRSLTSARAA